MNEKIHVLLIEDNAVDARLVKGMLECDEHGSFTLKHASTLGEGLHFLAPHSVFQVILLDLGLPDADGLQALRRIIPLAGDASVVVITGYQDEELGIAALREGAHDYVIKGQINNCQLRRTLRFAIERRKLSGALHAEIKERARIQHALELSEQRYRLLSETAPIGILLTNERGRLIDANKGALRMFGYEREELIGKTIEILLPERFCHSHQELRSGYMKEPHARPMAMGMELLARRKDGTEFPVEIGLGPLITNDGVLVSSTIIDITERRKLEEQRRLSQRMEAIGKLSGGVAHDFNNLLAVILGCSDVALEALPPDHPVIKKIEMIRKAGTSAADLTRQLLAYSRQQMIQPRVFELKEIVEQTQALLHRVIGENIEFRVLLDPSLGRVNADPGQIEQVLLNLAINARDAMPQGGSLTIQARNVELDDSYKAEHQVVIPGRYVMLGVEDTGCGMDRDTQARIFDPFFTTKELGKGTGLGLATVYGIIKQSGGYIWVYSELDKGTLFKVYLPRVDDSVQPAKQKEPVTPVLRACETILLAEDSTALREMAREYLESVGYVVLEAASGAEALQKAREYDGAIHLLLTDVVMPEMSGPELARQMAALRPQIRVIFTSGYTNDAIARQGVLDPGVTFIQKPFRPKALARKIQEVLAEPPSQPSDHASSALETPITAKTNQNAREETKEEKPHSDPHQRKERGGP
jgi:two-component system cell cycle sensor histidine kinase/response regulator CckA